MSWRPTTAMVLAAGLGTRMRPLTDVTPKPLVELAGRTLLDHVLDHLDAAGIGRAIVNVHYLADQIEAHVRARRSPAIIVSDERDALLETGGGIKRALPLLGDEPILVCNSDTVWVDAGEDNIVRLCAAWSERKMDCLLLLADAQRSLGYDGPGDFSMDAACHLARRVSGGHAPYVFAGVSIMAPRLAAEIEADRFSLNQIWDRAATRQRLFGCVLDGEWMHVGTPEALLEAEARLRAIGEAGRDGC